MRDSCRWGPRASAASSAVPVGTSESKSSFSTRGVSKTAGMSPTLEKVTEDKAWHVNGHTCGRTSEEGEITASPSARRRRAGGCRGLRSVWENSVDIQHHAAGAVNSRSEGIPLSPRPCFWCTLSGVIYFSRNDSAPLLSPESEPSPLRTARHGAPTPYAAGCAKPRPSSSHSPLVHCVELARGQHRSWRRHTAARADKKKAP